MFLAPNPPVYIAEFDRALKLYENSLAKFFGPKTLNINTEPPQVQSCLQCSMSNQQ